MFDSILALILITGGALLLGFLVGWSIRGVRAEQQKLALNAEWQEQFGALRKAEQRVTKQRQELSAEVARLRQQRLVSEFSDDTQPSRPRADFVYDDAQVNESAEAEAVSELKSQLEDSERRRDSLRHELDRLIERTREFTQASRHKDEKIFALSRELESWQQRLPPLVDRFRKVEFEHTTVLDALELERRRNEELSESMRTQALPEAFANLTELNLPRTAANSAEADHADGNGRDDLKRIRGVGPKLEQTLNALGIYRLQQIADFDDGDIERVAAELGRFPDRIRRDRWVEQARSLSR